MTSKTFKIYFHTGASASVTVTVPEGVDVEETREAAIGAGYDALEAQYLCAQCSGWGKDYSLDLAEWELDDASDAVVEVES